MKAVSCWDFAYGYLVSDRFTAIYNPLAFVFAFVLGLMVSQMSSRCKEMDRFFGELRRKKANLGIGFSSRSSLGGVCGSNRCGGWKFVKDSKVLSVENLKGAKEMGAGGRNWGGFQQIEDNVFMDCSGGNCGQTLLKARKWVDLGSGFCSGHDFGGLYCSNFLSYVLGFWRLMRILILWLVKNLNGGGKIDVGGGDSDCYQKGGGFADSRNRINSSTFNAREEEEEEVFEECEEGDFVELEQEHQNVAYLNHEKERVGAAFDDDVMDYIMRKFMKEDDDNEYEGKEHEDYEGLDLMGLKNALRIERENRNAAYLELEQERLAATTAAIEAMAMIQRLQNEKNLIEMEARQYHYMAEQRQIYDQEVIHHLQWIVSKHELERSVLENQLKECRKRLLQRGLFDDIVGEAEEHQDGETASDLMLGDN